MKHGVAILVSQTTADPTLWKAVAPFGATSAPPTKAKQTLLRQDSLKILASQATADPTVWIVPRARKEATTLVAVSSGCERGGNEEETLNSITAIAAQERPKGKAPPPPPLINSAKPVGAALREAAPAHPTKAQQTWLQPWLRRNDRLCKHDGCPRWRQSRCDGYCKAHFNLMVSGAKKESTILVAASSRFESGGNKEESLSIIKGIAAQERPKGKSLSPPSLINSAKPAAPAPPTKAQRTLLRQDSLEILASQATADPTLWNVPAFALAMTALLGETAAKAT